MLAGLAVGFGKLSRLRLGDRVRRSSSAPDEFENRDVIRVVVRDLSESTGIGRNGNHRNAGAVTEEVERLNITRVVVATAFVKGDQRSRCRPRVTGWPVRRPRSFW